MTVNPISVQHLSHYFGKKTIYRDLSLEFEQGKIYGILGKNGVGKTTLIKILMGFMKPKSGKCRIFGDPANAITPATRERVGLLFERHLAYSFFSIDQAERFMSRFYPRWKRERYYELVDVLGLPGTHRIAWMSEGQRSQVVLGLILAQDPDLLILDDYSMGLDAGYRRLFVDYLREHLKDGRHTVVLTSHVIQDMHRFVDDAVFLRRGGEARMMGLDEFARTFRCWRLDAERVPAGPARERLSRLAAGRAGQAGAHIVNVEEHADCFEIFSFHSREQAAGDLALLGAGIRADELCEVPMDLEDAFVGYTGRR
ncbi:MAG: ABC transporter ATP-binding protein [Desulfovibrio sp.]|nr:ABC transporter ATP-binding protein [Desulfovibrio sp.]